MARRIATRFMLAAACLGAAIALGVGIGVAHAADERLDLADALLEKAAVLLNESEAGVVDSKAQKKFDRSIDRALDHIAEARTQIENARDAVDNP
jgi:hypothetical protein